MPDIADIAQDVQERELSLAVERLELVYYLLLEENGELVQQELTFRSPSDCAVFRSKFPRWAAAHVCHDNTWDVIASDGETRTAFIKAYGLKNWQIKR